MKDKAKTKPVLIQELVSLRQRITELEQSESERKQVDALLLNDRRHVIVALHDITDHKRLEAELRESEERFRQVSLSITNIAYSCRRRPDGDYGIDWITGAVEPITGYSANEIHALGCWGQIVIEEDRHLFEKNVTALTPDAFGKCELRLRRKDGLVRWVLSFSRCIMSPKDPATLLLYGALVDISDRKQAEEDLRRSGDNFRRSLDDSPLGVRIVTEDSETIYANRAVLDINGFDSLEELKATPVENRYTPESFAEHQIRKEKRKRGDYDPPEYDISIIRKDGEVRHLQVFRKEVLWDGERQFQILYQDITERKRYEEEFRASREQLRALAVHLQTVREEERTNMAREIHDELGGTLTGMKVDVSFLIKSALKIENEAARTSLLAGMDSVTKSIDTTMHAVRRIAMELRPGILDDLGLVAALEWQLIDFEKRTGIRCELFPPLEDIRLDADLSTALFRIFQEALTNVARHSGATEVHARLRADTDSFTLEVEDNGKGIEKEKALSSKSLGLLGMRERAQMFEGRITVTGTPGIGTIVTVELPPVEKRKRDRDQEGAIG